MTSRAEEYVDFASWICRRDRITWYGYVTINAAVFDTDDATIHSKLFYINVLPPGEYKLWIRKILFLFYPLLFEFFVKHKLEGSVGDAE